jgi:hypothetical protein
MQPWAYHYNADDYIVCSSGTGTFCEGEEDPLNPPKDMNEDDWVARYHEHRWHRAAGQVGPIKTIPTYHKRPVAPAGPITALDTKLLVNSKVRQSASAAVAFDNAFLCLQAPGPPRPHHRPAKETAQTTKVSSAAMQICKSCS